MNQEAHPTEVHEEKEDQQEKATVPSINNNLQKARLLSEMSMSNERQKTIHVQDEGEATLTVSIKTISARARS